MQRRDISVGDLFEKEVPCLQRRGVGDNPPVKQKLTSLATREIPTSCSGSGGLEICLFLQPSLAISLPPPSQAVQVARLLPVR